MDRYAQRVRVAGKRRAMFPARNFPGGDVPDIVEGSPGHLWVATQDCRPAALFQLGVRRKGSLGRAGT